MALGLAALLARAICIKTGMSLTVAERNFNTVLSLSSIVSMPASGSKAMSLFLTKECGRTTVQEERGTDDRGSLSINSGFLSRLHWKSPANRSRRQLSALTAGAFSPIRGGYAHATAWALNRNGGPKSRIVLRRARVCRARNARAKLTDVFFSAPNIRRPSARSRPNSPVRSYNTRILPVALCRPELASR